MNRQQFQSLIQQHLVAAPAEQDGHPSSPQAAGSRDKPSLARQARSVQKELNTWKSRLAAPDEPLPSAECVAAFVAGTASPEEDAAVIAACVHDIGILVQVLVAWQSEFVSDASQANSYPQEVSADLACRLLQLRSSESSLGLSSSSTAQTDSQSKNSTASQSSSSRPVPQPVSQPAPESVPKSATPSRLAWGVLAGALAASLLWAVSWWLVSRSAPQGPGAGGPMASSTPQQPSDQRALGDPAASDPQMTTPEKSDVPPTEATIQPPRIASQDPPVESGQDSSEEPAISPQADPPSAPLLAQDEATSEMEQPSVSDLDQLPMQSELAERTTTAPEEESPLLAPVTVTWTRIVGLVAQQTVVGYDRWRPIAEPRRSTAPATVDTDATEDSVAPATSSWLMLPGCYARGNLSSGGELILAEESRVTIYGEDNELQLHLLQGTAATRELPPGTRVRLVQSGRAGPVATVEEAATLFFWLESNQLYASLLSGRVAWGGQEIESQQKLQVGEEMIAATGDKVETPAWLDRLPTNQVLSRSVLGNLARADELNSGIDQSLQSIMQGASWQSNPRSVRDLELLARWRGSLAVKNPLEPAIHPLWPVRSAQLMRLFSPRDGTTFDLARRQFASQLSAGQVNNYAAWQAMLQQQQAPARADVAQWLGYLDGPDPLLAATADLLLRSLVAAGPAFDPQAPVQQRSLVRTQWARIIADGNRTRGR